VEAASLEAAAPAVAVPPSTIAPPPEPAALARPQFRTEPPPLPIAAPAPAAPLPDTEAVPTPPIAPESSPMVLVPVPEPLAETAAVQAEPPAPPAEEPQQPVEVQAAPPTRIAQAAPTHSPPVAQPMDPALRDSMLRRGQALVAIGDISGARRFLERAAQGGSAAAAMAMAETYDPGSLARLGVIGLPADPAAALSWYRRALALGAAEAAARIATLEAQR
jgi:hypothetical protein